MYPLSINTWKTGCEILLFSSWTTVTTLSLNSVLEMFSCRKQVAKLLVKPNPLIRCPSADSVSFEQSDFSCNLASHTQEASVWILVTNQSKAKPQLSLSSSDTGTFSIHSWTCRTTWTYIQSFLEQRLSHHVSQHPDQRCPLQTARRHTFSKIIIIISKISAVISGWAQLRIRHICWKYKFSFPVSHRANVAFYLGRPLRLQCYWLASMLLVSSHTFL